ncbi:unnamed protein product [Protopolystoma xenopodis]|uniref:Uncharacterized protein n=1 Tax=Protopolystoma xenopodis TaxID=117903 RepID=A0A448WK25_9PLAT|nr:unnamed protein product [Protopolystoma xenopodis]
MPLFLLPNQPRPVYALGTSPFSFGTSICRLPRAIVGVPSGNLISSSFHPLHNDQHNQIHRYSRDRSLCLHCPHPSKPTSFLSTALPLTHFCGFFIGLRFASRHIHFLNVSPVLAVDSGN